MRSDAHDKNTGPRIVLNNERLQRKLRKLHPDHQYAYQLAQVMGIHPTQLGRVINGETLPGTKFIAALLLTVGITSFGDGLFDIIPGEDVA